MRRDHDRVASGHLEGRLGGVSLFVVVAVVYYAGSRVAFELLQVADLGAAFFAPSGVMVGALALCPVRRWWIVVSAGALAEAVIDVQLSGYRWPEVGGFVAANMLETVLIASLMLWWLDRRPDLTRRVDLTAFITATVIGTALGASIGAWTIQASGSAPWWPSFYQWWLGDGLGVLTIGTTIVALNGPPDRRPLWSLEGAIVISGIVLLSLAVYASGNMPLGFLVLVAVIPAAARFGTQAVTVLFTLVTAMVIVLVTHGDVLAGGFSEAMALVIFKLQFVAFISAGLYVAAESSEREQAQRTAAREHQTVPSPGELLDELDRQARHIDGAAGTTLWVALVDPQRQLLHYSSAGHLPALLIDGTDSRWLDGARSVPLGFSLANLTDRTTATVRLSETNQLLLFTDGAVERPGEIIDLGLERLRRHLHTTDTLTELLNVVKDPTARDDAVLLRVTLGSEAM